MTDAYAALMLCPPLQKIPERDRISLVTLGGYDVIIRNEDFEEGALGLFISVDSVLPPEMVEHYKLQHIKGGRIKTMKLKNIYSQGLFLPISYDGIELTGDVQLDQNIAPQLGITKWKPVQKLYKGTSPNVKVKAWADPRIEIYDLESIQRPDFANVFKEGDEVIITEKLHGMNATFCKVNGEINVMSRKLCFERDPKSKDASNILFSIFDRYGFEKLFNESKRDNFIIRGEVYGKGIQQLDYGLQQPEFKAFDISFEPGKYLNYKDFMAVCIDNDIPFVPELYHGEFNMDMVSALAEQDSVLKKGHVSEGVVIRDPNEPTQKNVPRRVLKYISKRYSLKDNSEERLDE